MSEPQSISIRSCEKDTKPIVYRAYEFAKPSSGGGYVKVREYRTYRYRDGRVNHEVVLMESPFEELVRAFHGDFQKAGKQLTGCFEGPDLAKECARRIDNLYGKTVKVSGNVISLVV